MMSNGINKQHSQHHQRWDKANTNAADWGGTWESGGKLLGEACSPRPKQEKGREGKGSRRQPPLSHVNLWNYLHTVKSTGRRGLTAALRAAGNHFPFPPLFLHVKEFILKQYNHVFFVLLPWSAFQRERRQRNSPVPTSCCCSLCPAVPASPRWWPRPCGPRDIYRSWCRLGNTISISRGCPCGRDTPGQSHLGPKGRAASQKNMVCHG